MEVSVDDQKFAILIDADNISAKYIPYVLDELSNYGVATYKRIYGDWTRTSNTSWKEVLLEHSITPIQQYSYTTGKNATDSAMIIDAMDILYSKNVEGFCIVSSDSDFTKLSSRLRESGMFVIGMGERKTPKPFIASCNVFKYLDVLEEAEKKNIAQDHDKMISTANGSNSQQTAQPEEMTDLKVIRAAILKIVDEKADGTQGINLGELGSLLQKRYPDFDVRNYGDTKFSKFLRKFEFLQIKTLGNNTSLWVTLKKEEAQIQVAPQVQQNKVNKNKKKRNRKKPATPPV
jgi:hypothetical protein